MDLFQLFDVPQNFKKCREKGYTFYIKPGGNILYSVLIGMFIELIEQNHVRKSCSLIITKLYDYLSYYQELNKLLQNLVIAKTKKEALQNINRQSLLTELLDLSTNYLQSEFELKNYFELSRDLNLRILILKENDEEICISNFQYPCPAFVSIKFTHQTGENESALILLKSKMMHICIKPKSKEAKEEFLYSINKNLFKTAEKKIIRQKFEEAISLCSEKYFKKYKKILDKLSPEARSESILNPQMFSSIFSPPEDIGDPIIPTLENPSIGFEENRPYSETPEESYIFSFGPINIDRSLVGQNFEEFSFCPGKNPKISENERESFQIQDFDSRTGLSENTDEENPENKVISGSKIVPIQIFVPQEDKEEKFDKITENQKNGISSKHGFALLKKNKTTDDIRSGISIAHEDPKTPPPSIKTIFEDFILPPPLINPTGSFPVITEKLFSELVESGNSAKKEPDFHSLSLPTKMPRNPPPSLIPIQPCEKKENKNPGFSAKNPSQISKEIQNLSLNMLSTEVPQPSLDLTPKQPPQLIPIKNPVQKLEPLSVAEKAVKKPPPPLIPFISPTPIMHCSGSLIKKDNELEFSYSTSLPVKVVLPATILPPPKLILDNKASASMQLPIFQRLSAGKPKIKPNYFCSSITDSGLVPAPITLNDFINKKKLDERKYSERKD